MVEAGANEGCLRHGDVRRSCETRDQGEREREGKTRRGVGAGSAWEVLRRSLRATKAPVAAGEAHRGQRRRGGSYLDPDWIERCGRSSDALRVEMGFQGPDLGPGGPAGFAAARRDQGRRGGAGAVLSGGAGGGRPCWAAPSGEEGLLK